MELEVSVSSFNSDSFETLCREHGLVVTLKTSSAKHPGSTHWHFKRGREKGTLEATYWPAQNRFWFAMKEGRKADWVMEVAGEMKEKLEE